MRKSQMLYSRGYLPRRQASRPRRYFSKKKLIVFLLILIFILGLAYLFIFSSVFRIKDIKISGNQVISNEEIVDSLHNFLFKKILFFFNRNNILLATGNKLKNILIGDFPRISSLEIHKNIFKQTINLKIIERKEAGIYCRNECYYIDNQGVIFEEAPQTSGTLILVVRDYSAGELEIGKNVLEKEFMAELIDLRSSLFEGFKLKVLDFNLESSPAKELKVNTHEGWYILFDTSRDFKNQLDNLKLVLEEKIKDGRKNLQYVDLRIESRVYYK